jgi:hypothetical protein
MHRAHCITFSKENPYANSDDQCLDYVLVRNVGVVHVELVMTERLIGQALAYSDHYGLLSDITLNGDKLNQYAVDIAPVIEGLYERVRNELIDAEAQQMKHMERAVLGLSSILDAWMFSAFIRRFSKGLEHMLRWLGFGFGIGFALWQIMQAGLNLESRKNTLEALRQELEKQIRAKRLFDGREW